MRAEIFSFAELPWSGVEETEVVGQIQNRAKLEQPEACPDVMYQLMLGCWKLDVHLRTSSALIHEIISRFVSDPDNDVIAYEGLNWPDLSSDGGPRRTQSLSLYAVDLESPELLESFQALEVSAESVSLGKELGKGQFGTVNLATLAVSGSEESVSVAVKTMRLEGVPEAEQQQFAYEARLLVALRHPNIVRVLAVCFQSSPQMICLELMAGGDLRLYLKAHREELVALESDELLIGVCRQLAEAMVYLSRSHVIHRDLAARYACNIVPRDRHAA